LKKAKIKSTKSGAFLKKIHLFMSKVKKPNHAEKKDNNNTPHTNNAQRLLIINWLQIKENFALITGSAAQGQKLVAGKKLKKTDAYKDLAKYVSDGSKIAWDSKQAKARYEGYLNTYKKTKAASDSTEWGLNEEDYELGIETIEDKLEYLCPNFQALDELFGGR
jgi:hypothetical protein